MAEVNAATPRAPVARWKWGVVWLLFLATTLNYMDRQALGSTAGPIKDEFKLDEEDYGWLEFSFGITYALALSLSGYIADRVSLRWLYAAAMVVWSAAGFLTGLADTVWMLMACRVVLGFGEAFNWPCAVACVRRLIPPGSRPLANGIFHGGASIGATITPLVVLAVAGPTLENWRLVFQVVGVLGLVWLVLWLWVIRGPRVAEISSPAEEESSSAAAGGPPARFRDIVLLRNFWVIMAVAMAVNLAWHFLRIWMPRFLVVDLKVSQRDLQYLLAGYFVAAALGSTASGWVTQRLTRSGWSVVAARKVVMFGVAGLCLLSTPAVLLKDPADPWPTVLLMFVVGAGALGGFAIYFSLTQDISARHTALVLGFTSTVSWVVVAVMQPYVGRWVDGLGTFGPSFIAAGCLPLGGAIAGLFWIEPTGTEERPDS